MKQTEEMQSQVQCLQSHLSDTDFGRSSHGFDLQGVVRTVAGQVDQDAPPRTSPLDAPAYQIEMGNSCPRCRPKRSGRGALGYTLMLIMNDILHRDQFHRDFEIIMLLT